MKKIIALFLLLSSGLVSAQDNLNDYQYVIVPVKFDFLSSENLYRLSTITKLNLTKLGFKVFYSNEQLPSEASSDRCDKLYLNIEKKPALLQTKLVLVLKDCQNKVIFEGEEGKSREKELAVAFPEALDKAFVSLRQKDYAYNGKVLTSVVVSNNSTSSVKEVTKTQPVSSPKIEESADYLFAQPIANGYQLVDKTPKIVLKIYKTSQPDYFTAQGDGINGALLKKNGEWVLEYYKNDQPVSEKLLIKF